MYDLLARLLVREVDDDLVVRLTAEPVSALLAKVEPALPAYLAAFDEQARREAEAEYCALFLLPGGVPPRAAAWVEGALPTSGAAVAREAHQTLAALGQEVAPGPWGKLPLDHFGLLLSLAAAGGEEVARRLVEPWAHRYGRALVQKAKSPLYRATGGLLCSL